MSQVEGAVTSSSKEKRQYRKGNPMSATERQLAAIARKRETHKELKVFVKNPLKDQVIAICEEEGLTQAEFIESLLERELAERGKRDVKASRLVLTFPSMWRSYARSVNVIGCCHCCAVVPSMRCFRDCASTMTRWPTGYNAPSLIWPSSAVWPQNQKAVICPSPVPPGR